MISHAAAKSHDFSIDDLNELTESDAAAQFIVRSELIDDAVVTRYFQVDSCIFNVCY